MIPTIKPHHPYSPNRPSLFGSLPHLLLQVPWKPLLQRLPGSLLLLLLPFALFAPIYAPLLFGFYFILLHLFFVANNIRSAYAVYTGYTLSLQSSLTDWYAKYLQKTGTNSGSDTSHDLPFDQVIHVIILPNYKEEMDTLCETLDVLASHLSAITQYKICLAMEESEPGSAEKAQSLIQMYSDSFFEITCTIHPAGRPGEIRGKSSNVAWAATQMALRGNSHHEHEILTIMDADTCFAQDYFTSVTYHYTVASPEQRRIMMFAPTTVFDRNAKSVPMFVRATDMFWSIGVMSNMYPSSPIKIPCSAYSVSMDLALAVNFWDSGPEAIGEDMHMYIKCFFCTQGNVIVKSIFSPASQCNIEGEGTGIQGYISGIYARYVQAKRHLWGSLDSGYALRRFILSVLSPETQSTIYLKNHTVTKFGKEQQGSGFKVYQLLSMAHRLLEAHVIMGHFVVLLIATSLFVPTSGALYLPLAESFWSSLSAHQVHPFVVSVLNIGFWMRLFIVPINLFMFYYYEKYHQWVGFDRWALQDTSCLMSGRRVDSAADLSYPPSNVTSTTYEKVQYLGKRPGLASARSYPTHLFDWFSVPVSGLLFYVFPQFDAQISQLFTDRLDYKVAAKPTLHRPPIQVSHKSTSDKLLSPIQSLSSPRSSAVLSKNSQGPYSPHIMMDAYEVKSTASSKGDEGYFEEFDEPLSSVIAV